MARARLEASPAKDPNLEARAKTVQQPATKRPAQKNLCPRPMAAAPSRRSEATRLAAVVPRAASPGIGEAPCGQGEDLMSRPSEYPVGTKRSGERGGLVGAIPEALCGEAPKGQPVIRRPRPRQHRNGPTVEEENRRSLGKAKDQSSSRWTRRGESDDGDLSPEPR